MASTPLLVDCQHRAQVALAGSPFYELHELRVEPHADALVISGRVTSFYHKQLAQEIVRAVCDGIELRNSVSVSEGHSS